MPRSRKEIDEYNEKHKNLFNFLSFIAIFVLPLIVLMVIGYVSVKLEGNRSGGSGRCYDHMGSFDC